MYPYHNINIKRIKNGELVAVKNGEGEFAFVLIFDTYPYTRPIRQHSAWRYAALLEKYHIKAGGSH